MKRVFFILTITAICLCLNAQTDIDKLPQLPPANELAKGNIASYTDRLYSERSKEKKSTYDDAQKELKNLEEKFKDVPLSNMSMEEAMGIGNSPAGNNSFSGIEIPDIENMSEQELSEYIMKMTEQQMGNIYSGLDMNALANMSEEEQQAYIMKQYTQQQGSPLAGMDMNALANMSEEEQAEYAMKIYSQQTGGANPLAGMDLNALANMSEEEQQAYVMKQMGGISFGGIDLESLGDTSELENISEEEIMKQAGMNDYFKDMGMDMDAYMKMGDEEQEEYLMQMAAKQMGMPVEDYKKMDAMSDSELEAWYAKYQEEGTPQVRQYNQAKQSFDEQCVIGREKAKEQMRMVYNQKYRDLIKNAENDMESCNKSTPDCFWQAYARWEKTQEDYKVECYAIWRNQIVKEQEDYKQMCKQNDPQSQNTVFSDYMSITLAAFDLPEREWLYE